MSEMTDSRFNMWRMVVAVAHADKVFTADEREMVQNYIEKLPFDSAQRNQLITEIDKAVSVDDIWPLVTEKKDRSQAIYFARLMLWSDGILHPDEKQILDKMHGHVMSKVDIQSALAQVDSIREQAEEDQPRGLGGVFQSFFDLFGG